MENIINWFYYDVFFCFSLIIQFRVECLLGSLILNVVSCSILHVVDAFLWSFFDIFHVTNRKIYGITIFGEIFKYNYIFCGNSKKNNHSIVIQLVIYSYTITSLYFIFYSGLINCLTILKWHTYILLTSVKYV